jgi:hypothetical protein
MTRTHVLIFTCLKIKLGLVPEIQSIFQLIVFVGDSGNFTRLNFIDRFAQSTEILSMTEII